MAQRCWSAPDPLPPVYLCLAAPLRHCPFDSLLHSPTEPSFCSFCEQKQRISGAVAHCSTWNTVHFVNRNSAAALLHVEHCSFCEQKQRSNGTAAQRLTINTAVHARVDRCTEASTIASLRIESLRHSGAADHDRAQRRIPATLSRHCAAATMLLACILRRRSAVSDQTGRAEPGEV